MAHKDIDPLYVASRLSYNPETGDLFWTENPLNWKVQGKKAGCVDGQGYIVIRMAQSNYRAHRLACVLSGIDVKGKDVDHINGDPLDNRLENLRVASHQENMRNQKKREGTSSKWKGVTWDKQRGKWNAKIRHSYKTINLGRYDDEREAAEAYMFAALELHGDYARLE